MYPTWTLEDGRMIRMTDHTRLEIIAAGETQVTAVLDYFRDESHTINHLRNWFKIRSPEVEITRAYYARNSE